MRKLVKILIVLVIIISVLAFLFFGLAKLIYHYKTCDRFVIDHIETRTGFNIPSIKKREITCIYSTKTNLKYASYVINTSKVNLDKYIDVHNLQKLDSIDLQTYVLLKDSVKGTQLYGKQNTPDSHHWEGILNKKTAKLSFGIKYN